LIGKREALALGDSSYKDLQVWQKSLAFANEVIQVIDDLDTPRKHFRLIEQLESAVTSIPMNIAEGAGRKSTKEFIHFLYISRGSLYETLTLLELFKLRGWLKQNIFTQFEKQSIEIAKMLKGLINYLSQRQT
jgi:four helix bundle protein